MKIYKGIRRPDGAKVFVGDRELNPRNDLRNHSPDGFEWGYGGSGPSQLALALLAHHLSDDQAAFKLYQDFKWMCIASLPKAGWVLTSEDLDRAIAEILASGNAQTESPPHDSNTAGSQAGVAVSPANPNANVKQVFPKGRWT